MKSNFEKQVKGLGDGALTPLSTNIPVIYLFLGAVEVVW
jgi:hypothetical protein